MDVQTLQKKSISALYKELDDTKSRLQELRFKLSSNQLKNVRDVRILKRTIARINTILVQKQKLEGENN